MVLVRLISLDLSGLLVLVVQLSLEVLDCQGDQVSRTVLVDTSICQFLVYL